MNAEILEKRFEPIAQDPNEILTVQQAAQVLKVSCSHMLRLIRGGVNGMPRVYKVRAGRTLPVRRGAITQWIRDVEHHSAELSDEHMRCRSEPSLLRSQRSDAIVSGSSANPRTLLVKGAKRKLSPSIDLNWLNGLRSLLKLIRAAHGEGVKGSELDHAKRNREDASPLIPL